MTKSAVQPSFYDIVDVVRMGKDMDFMESIDHLDAVA